MAPLRDWLTHPARPEILARAACVAVFLVLFARFWHPHYGFTRFLQLDAGAAQTMTSRLQADRLYVYALAGGYDGHYYGQLASDPTLRDPELGGGMDNFSYRARRILTPAVAQVLAWGDPVDAMRTYSWLNGAAWLALAWIAGRLLPTGDWRRTAAWAGLMFTAGALHSVRLALVDLPALAWLAGAWLAWERGRIGWVGVCLACAALTRETSLLAVAVLAVLTWRRDHWRAAALMTMIAVVPIALWFAFLQARFGHTGGGWDNMKAMLFGLGWKWREAVGFIAQERDRWVAVATLLAVLGISVQIVFFLWPRPRVAAWWLGIGYVALALTLNVGVWEGHPGAAFRVLLPLALAFYLVAGRERVSWVWLLIGSLAVPSGLLALSRVMHEHRELSAGRHAGGSYVVHTDEGFYFTEHGGGRSWAWARGAGEITCVTWPRRDPNHPATVAFEARAMSPRALIVRMGDRVVWEGQIGTRRTAVRVPGVEWHNGRAVLRFESPTPPDHEGGETGRLLAFAIYDVRVE